ncbi:HUTU hydratase, partial [Atractosteus spatula]|nr:HUTU hydratase [Atractosteus spatula]
MINRAPGGSAQAIGGDGGVCVQSDDGVWHTEGSPASQGERSEFVTGTARARTPACWLSLKELCAGLPLSPLPPNRGRDPGVPHAPVRTPNLSEQEEKLALRNALRYIPPELHTTLAPEFAQELRLFGHIYMYRFCPPLAMRAYPIDQYPCRTRQAAAIMHMIMNNLDPAVAQFPQELVTYGGNGQVFSNWAQFWLVMHFLSEMTEAQTLVMYSGHPLGLFPSPPLAPRLVITNGMARAPSVIPNYSSREEYDKMFALGVTMYGQMTAGSYCYIGPQGIVHGTLLTVLNAGRRYLGSGELGGRVFVTAGLGGMSGAQAKAAVIAGCVGVIAEVDEAALKKRHEQGWLMEVTSDLDRCVRRIRHVRKSDLPSGSVSLAVLFHKEPEPGQLSYSFFMAQREARKTREALSLGYHGNVVDLWSGGKKGPAVGFMARGKASVAREKREFCSVQITGMVLGKGNSCPRVLQPQPETRRLAPSRGSTVPADTQPSEPADTLAAQRQVERLVQEYEASGELLVDLGSDQTSCHNPFSGGYYPAQLSLSQAQELMHSDPAHFRCLVQESLRRQVAAINKLAEAGMFFWDYGNAFLLEAQRAGADVEKSGAGKTEFKYPSYVQHIMGEIFSLGFGPFRWVCTSGDPSDLAQTDDIAAGVLDDISRTAPERVRQQYSDNSRWIRQAGRHSMVVGSQARILYSDQKGRVAIALAINRAIAEGRIKAPVVISRDHHDVSGTDSPFRETSNIYDGSAFCADMAVQNFVGDAFRGATWVALHNGGGVGWGEVVNGGFGLVLDGSEEAGQRARMMLNWDVSNGVARRCWSGNASAHATIQRAMEEVEGLRVVLPFSVHDDGLLERALRG